jgi:hypothetical protein
MRRSNKGSAASNVSLERDIRFEIELGFVLSNGAVAFQHFA